MTKEQSQILLYIVVFIVIAFNMLKMKKNYEVLKKQKEEEERLYKESHSTNENYKDPESYFLTRKHKEMK